MNPETRQFLENLLAKAASDEYFFRGEPAHYEHVSSGLYRKLDSAAVSLVDKITEVEQGMIEAAKSYANMSGRSDDAVLSELQHYGGKTNLIDFSRDCMVALFFACGLPGDRNGRVICLEQAKRDYVIVTPSENRSRVIAQKSVFVKSPTGIIFPEDEDVLVVPRDLKPALRAYLRQVHGISHQSMYTDIIGFIDFQDGLLDGYINIGSQSPIDEVNIAVPDMPDWLKVLHSQST